MNQAENRALSRAAVLLVVASVVRLLYGHRPLPSMVVPERPDAEPELLQEALAIRDDGARRSRPLAEGERLDPNVADEADLDRLPGIGPSAARAIVEERERSGGFSGPGDLLRVSGVGASTLARIESHLTFSRTGRRPERGQRSLPDDLIDLNRASAEELQALPGVGPALAARIVEHREARGRFSDVDDLLEVSGIGEKTLERFRTRLRVR